MDQFSYDPSTDLYTDQNGNSYTPAQMTSYYGPSGGVPSQNTAGSPSNNWLDSLLKIGTTVGTAALTGKPALAPAQTAAAAQTKSTMLWVVGAVIALIVVVVLFKRGK